MSLGSFIGVGRSLERAVERVQRAERLGYESVYVTHIAGRDSLIVLAAYAARTASIRLGTGVLPIYSRTPVATAQSAATIDELSGGRMVLGIGISHQTTNQNWYGQTIERPVREMRAYAEVVRAILRGDEPPANDRFPTRFRFMGFEPRPDLPLYVAALSPAMLRLAGELADGALLWLCNPDYIADVVIPEVRRGRERAGRSLDGFDVVAAVPAAVTDDPESARDKLRGDLVPYFTLPYYRAMLERSGFGEDIAAFDSAQERQDPGAAAAAISDRFLATLSAIGREDEAAESVRRYLAAGATSPCIGGVPGTDFDATLEALAEVTAERG